ncbi:MAG: HAD-IIIC family phosphatase [Sphingobium sp.]
MRIDYRLARIAEWATHVPTFVTNFMTPQQDVNGRFYPRGGAGSGIGLIEALNRHIEMRVVDSPDLHLLDIDRLVGVYGRRFVQDDGVLAYTHGGFAGDYAPEWDADRIVKALPPSQHYAFAVPGFLLLLWREAVAMHRSLRAIDLVKLVCVDLDDTLWRGVPAETGVVDDPRLVEGWPLGIAEALLALRRRGILLALLSKNDEERIRAIWPRIFQDRLRLEDFAILRIGWADKATTIGEAMAAANILPRNTVFLDDNRASGRRWQRPIPTCASSARRIITGGASCCGPPKPSRSSSPPNPGDGPRWSARRSCATRSRAR